MVSQCNTLNLRLFLCHSSRSRMQIDFLEAEVFICLEVASRHILVAGKVCNSLDILNMGVLTKLIVRRIEYVLSMYWYVLGMY
jgi:hypothetical protein